MGQASQRRAILSFCDKKVTYYRHSLASQGSAFSSLPGLSRPRPCPKKDGQTPIMCGDICSNARSLRWLASLGAHLQYTSPRRDHRFSNKVRPNPDFAIAPRAPLVRSRALARPGTKSEVPPQALRATLLRAKQMRFRPDVGSL